MQRTLLTLAISAVLASPAIWAEGQTTFVSTPDGDGTGWFGGGGFNPSISKDGNLVAFESDSSHLVSGDTNSATDVFVKNRTTNATTRVSVATGGVQANSDSYGAQISANGQFVLFQSDATNLVPGKTGQGTDVFVHELSTGTTSQISVSQDGKAAGIKRQVFICDQTPPFDCHNQDVADAPADSQPLSISGDGRYVLFSSNATNLVAEEKDEEGNVIHHANLYIRDRVAGSTSVVHFVGYIDDGKGNVTLKEFAPAGVSDATLSEDGKFLAFSSGDSRFVMNDPNITGDGDTNGTSDVFRYDWQAKTAAVLVSVATDGKSAFTDEKTEIIDTATNAVVDTYSNGASSHSPRLSADGSKVAFVSDAANLVSNDTNHARDVFLRDLGTSLTSRVSVASGDVETRALGCFQEDDFQSFGDGKIQHSISFDGCDDAGSDSPSISSDGGNIVFSSRASNLVSNDFGGNNLFVHEMAGHQTTVVSIATDGTFMDAYGPGSISGDGRFVAFGNVYVHDRVPEADVISTVNISNTGDVVSLPPNNALNAADIIGNGSRARLDVTIRNRGGALAAGVVATVIVPKTLKIRALKIREPYLSPQETVDIFDQRGDDPCTRRRSRAVKGSMEFVCNLGNLSTGQEVYLSGILKAKKDGEATIQVQIPIAGNETLEANNNSQLKLTVQ